ncbi:unnamed protein product [Paramecium primaurelia]|uniref:Uncharacterized protein n=1 Tax=Paramecium primaurelia TaxID=5886 RepID=A0A8S1QEY1_PARPR|nr:unnamed protein product [Paramecium primaurelia]
MGLISIPRTKMFKNVVASLVNECIYQLNTILLKFQPQLVMKNSESQDSESQESKKECKQEKGNGFYISIIIFDPKYMYKFKIFIFFVFLILQQGQGRWVKRFYNIHKKTLPFVRNIGKIYIQDSLKNKIPEMQNVANQMKLQNMNIKSQLGNNEVQSYLTEINLWLCVQKNSIILKNLHQISRKTQQKFKGRKSSKIPHCLNRNSKSVKLGFIIKKNIKFIKQNYNRIKQFRESAKNLLVFFSKIQLSYIFQNKYEVLQVFLLISRNSYTIQNNNFDTSKQQKIQQLE